jgi:hypothetical protein
VPAIYAIHPENIQVGRGEISFGVPIPATGSTVPLDANGIPTIGGQHMGATLTAPVWIYRPSALDINIEQSTGLVGQVLTAEELRIEFELGEITAANVKNYFLGGSVQGTPPNEFTSFGDNLYPFLSSMLIVSPMRSVAGKYIEAMLYKCSFPEERS